MYIFSYLSYVTLWTKASHHSLSYPNDYHIHLIVMNFVWCLKVLLANNHSCSKIANWPWFKGDGFYFRIANTCNIYRADLYLYFWTYALLYLIIDYYFCIWLLIILCFHVITTYLITRHYYNKSDSLSFLYKFLSGYNHRIYKEQADQR